MADKTFPARPLGKYGHVYLLDKRAYWLYRLVGITAIGGSLILAIMGIIVSHYYSLPWSSDSLVNCGILVALVGSGIALNIASRGRVASQDEVEKMADTLTRRSAALSLISHTYSWFTVISAIILLLISALAAAAALYLHRPVPVILLVFAIPSVLILMTCWPNQRKRR
jgi:hypothetical protein